MDAEDRAIERIEDTVSEISQARLDGFLAEKAKAKEEYLAAKEKLAGLNRTAQEAGLEPTPEVKALSEPEPSIGRIVHYVSGVNATVAAAVITGVYLNGYVDLTVFPAHGLRPQTYEGVPSFNPDKIGLHGWRWPERV